MPLAIDRPQRRESAVPIGTLVLILLVLILIGAIPTWPHSRNWGYYPSGIAGVLVLLVVVLLVLGYV
jgi:hypothetical protein